MVITGLQSTQTEFVAGQCAVVANETDTTAFVIYVPAIQRHIDTVRRGVVMGTKGCLLVRFVAHDEHHVRFYRLKINDQCLSTEHAENR